MTKNGGGKIASNTYTGLADVGRIQLIFGAIIISILTLIVVIGGFISNNPLLVVGGFLFGAFCLWIQYSIYNSKAASAIDGGLTSIRLLRLL